MLTDYEASYFDWINMTKNGLEYDRKNSHRLKVYACTWACVSSASSGAVLCCYCCGLALVSTLLILVAPGQSYAHKIARLQAVVVVKAVWGIFNNTNRSLFTSNTLLVIYKSRYYSMYLSLSLSPLSLSRKNYPFIKICETCLIRGRNLIRVTQNKLLGPNIENIFKFLWARVAWTGSCHWQLTTTWKDPLGL